RARTPVVVKLKFDWGSKGVNHHMHNMLMAYTQAFLQRLGRDEEGQTAVEYALVLALVALVIVGVLATGASTVISQVVAQLTTTI
ncbi:MAG: hypothetical protein JWO74_4142, partial [Solirubrobacterales bacterium]|nr:hypothetical protein [Solirubrobacterales bacterium]